MVAVGKRGEVEEVAEGESRPCVERTDRDDVAGLADLVGEVVGQKLLVLFVDGDGKVDRVEGLERAHVELQVALAILEIGDLGADRFLEGFRVHARFERLAGADEAGGVVDRGLQRLAGEEDQRRFEDGEDEHHERDADDAEFNRRGAVVAPREAGDQHPRAAEASGNRGFDFPGKQHRDGRPLLRRVAVQISPRIGAGKPRFKACLTVNN